MRVYECSYKRCRLDTKSAFRTLNFGYGGMMLRVINALHKQEGEMPRDDTRVVYAKDNGVILGWAVLVDPALYNFGGSEVHFYVRSEHRRKGVGTRLMGAARRAWGPDFKVCRHDETSRGFFDSCSVS